MYNQIINSGILLEIKKRSRETCGNVFKVIYQIAF